MRKNVLALLVAVGALFAAPMVSGAADTAPPIPPKAVGKVSKAPSHKPGTYFLECTNCPLMTVIPAGQFRMGSLDNDDTNYHHEESPQHLIRIAKPFAVGVYSVTRGQFAAFIAASGYRVAPGCGVFTIPYVEGQQKFHVDPMGGWSNPNFKQTENDPVVCVSWDDANAYIAWLNKMVSKSQGAKDGGPYRLLTESEWEYATRAGTTTRYFWGDDRAQACRYANAADLSGKRVSPDWVVPNCDDGYVTTSPVGTFQPNPFGLYDIVGNAWQWVEDCWVANYDTEPTDGSARITAGCPMHSARGGSWRYDAVRGLRSASRGNDNTDAHFASVGFRVARSLN